MIQNAKTFPKVYYGLHFCPGVAEYREPNKEPYRIFLNEDTIRKMNPTYEGKPVYVRHVQEVDLENLQEEADGYVVKSFYNASDGKTWVEFIVVSDRGHEAIRNGWKLSNSYIPKQFGVGGVWNGVDYTKEITNAEFEHLAIVPDPRYAESIILSPEQFKEYNEKKALDLKRVANSQKGDFAMLNFFKKTKVENSADFETMAVVLPKSKVERTIAQLVNEADAIHNMHGYANGDHLVKVGNEEMTVNELVEKHMALHKKNEEKKEPEMANDEEKKEPEMANDDEMGDEEAKKKALELAEHEDKEIAAEKKKNKDEEKHDNEEDEEKKEKKQNNFKSLKNAHLGALKVEQPIELSADKLARGKARYGS